MYQILDWDRDTKILAQGLLSRMESSEFIVAFVVAKNSLQPIKPLASKLQKRDLDIYYAYTLIDGCISQLTDIRSNMDTVFNEWFTEMSEISDIVDNPINIPRIATRQINRPNAPSIGLRNTTNIYIYIYKYIYIYI